MYFSFFVLFLPLKQSTQRYYICIILSEQTEISWLMIDKVFCFVLFFASYTQDVNTDAHRHTIYSMKRYNTSGAVITNKKTQEHQCNFNQFLFFFLFRCCHFPGDEVSWADLCFSILFMYREGQLIVLTVSGKKNNHIFKEKLNCFVITNAANPPNAIIFHVYIIKKERNNTYCPHTENRPLLCDL